MWLSPTWSMSSLKIFANSSENLVKYSSTCENLDSPNPVIGFLPALLPRWHYFILQNPFVFNCQTAGVTESSLAHLSPAFANFHFQLFTLIRRFHTSVMTNYWWKPGSIFVSIPTYIFAQFGYPPYWTLGLRYFSTSLLTEHSIFWWMLNCKSDKSI